MKVLDFGIAKPIASEDGGELTLDGLVLGTPGFMSPEQAHGLPADARSDQYALGALLYSCLTLRKPYDYVEVGLPSRDKRYAVIRALKDGRGYPPPTKYRSDLPVPIEQAILRAMASEPSSRFESVFDSAARSNLLHQRMCASTCGPTTMRLHERLLLRKRADLRPGAWSRL